MQAHKATNLITTMSLLQGNASQNRAFNININQARVNKKGHAFVWKIFCSTEGTVDIPESAPDSKEPEEN